MPLHIGAGMDIYMTALSVFYPVLCELSIRNM